MMLHRARSHLTFANVMSMIAVFLALGTGIAIAHSASGSGGKILGYARVEANGKVVASQSKNIAAHNVGVGGGGIYCFDHLPFGANGAQATIDAVKATSAGAHVEVRKGATDCLPHGTNYEVVTSDETGAHAPEPFYIVFYR
jgi:hypothetical protein